MLNLIQKKFLVVARLFSFPALLYAIFVALRIKDIQPPMEGELGDFMTALNFLFGASSAYLVFVVMASGESVDRKALSLWWWLMCAFLTMLAFDELFMIHETIGQEFGINDTLVLLSYGFFLGLLLVFRVGEVFSKETLFFLVVFALLSLVSQASDYFYGEGSVIVMGRDISYEQFAESFGALSLTAAVVTIAIRQLNGRVGVDSSSRRTLSDGS